MSIINVLLTGAYTTWALLENILEPEVNRLSKKNLLYIVPLRPIIVSHPKTAAPCPRQPAHTAVPAYNVGLDLKVARFGRIVATANHDVICDSAACVTVL